MEVLMAAAIPNAAANSRAEICDEGLDFIQFTTYIVQFGGELGILLPVKRPFQVKACDAMMESCYLVTTNNNTWESKLANTV